MEPRVKFFAKLRHLVGHLEKETAHLQEVTEKQKYDDASEGACLTTLHDLQSQVRGFKAQLQEELVKSREEREAGTSFLHTWSEKRQKVKEALDTLSSYLEQYGYEPREPAQKHLAPGSESAESETQSEEGAGAGEEEEELEQETGEDDQGAGDEDRDEHLERPEDQEQFTPERIAPSLFTVICTPKLTDFGLSELHLQNMLKNYAVAQDPTPLPPKVLMSPVSVLPPVPKTPRCYLKLDEDAPTPRIEDFGISEHTLCFNNDFTMDLLQRKPPEPARKLPTDGPVDKKPLLPTCYEPFRFFSNENLLDTPEIHTPGFSITKKASQCVPAQRCNDSPVSPTSQSSDPISPELPTFETPYMRKLMNVQRDVKPESTVRRPEPSDPAEPSVPEDVPEVPVRRGDEELQRTPEMPSLQSDLCHTLQSMTVEARSLSIVNMGGEPVLGPKDPPALVLDLQENYTQEWNLASPRIRRDFDLEPRTPEMPDMSSITQDIFKLVSQCNTELKSAAIQPNLKSALQTTVTGKENKPTIQLKRLSLVTEKEFLGLASYFRQIPLARLNEAIQEINTALHQREKGGHSDPTGFQMHELRSLTGIGEKAPMFLLCLTQLQRVKHIHGTGNGAMYKLLPAHT